MADQLGFNQFEMDEKYESKDDVKINKEDEPDIDWNRVYLFQDVVFRESEAKDTSILVNHIITPSYNQSLFEFKYAIPRSHRPIRSNIISSIFSQLIPYYIDNKNNNDEYQSYSFYNKKLDILVGHLLINKNISNEGGASLINYLFLLWMDIIFKIPYKIGISSCWRLLQIHCAQKLIHFEFKKRFKEYKYQSIEMISVVLKYQNNGYGSYMIQKVHKEIYGDDNNKDKNDENEDDKLLPLMLTFTSTPQSIHFYQSNGYKQFIKVFIGVELTYYGFLYHRNTQYLDKILTAFPNNYEIDLSFCNHMLPNSIFEWILLVVAIPFVTIWVLFFIVLNMFKDCYR